MNTQTRPTIEGQKTHARIPVTLTSAAKRLLRKLEYRMNQSEYGDSDSPRLADTDLYEMGPSDGGGNDQDIQEYLLGEGLERAWDDTHHLALR